MQLGIASRVEFLDAIPRRELLTLCRQCDMGLSLMPQKSSDINEQAMTGASNKPFDYLACGLALLVSDLPDWRTLYVDNGHALAVDPADPASIATAIRWLLEHPGELRTMGERGRQRILQEWNYEQQFAPVLQRLTKRPFPENALEIFRNDLKVPIHMSLAIIETHPCPISRAGFTGNFNKPGASP